MNEMLVASPARTDRAAFPDLLREWRMERRMSQLALATEAGVSTRHLCFLEKGRSQPSREMVVLLASVLDIPLAAQNALLMAAGFAPLFSEAPTSGARSILLITSKSERVMPGPPLRGILSPAETSIT